MVDYTSGTGSGGVMLIRDLGHEVQFHIVAGSSQTFVGQLNWSWNSSTGAGDSATTSYPSGAQWLYLGSIYVDATQDIRFAIGATGTSGLGGPSEMTVRIDRAPPGTRPDPPTALAITGIGHTSMTFNFTGNRGDGGSPILRWEYQLWYEPSFSGAGIGNNGYSGTVQRSDLALAQNYYFRARGVNAIGASDWSNTVSARTLAGSKVRVNGVWREAVAMVKTNGQWRQAIPFVKKNNVWKDGK